MTAAPRPSFDRDGRLKAERGEEEESGGLEVTIRTRSSDRPKHVTDHKHLKGHTLRYVHI